LKSSAQSETSTALLCRKVKKWLRERRHKKEKGDDFPKRVMWRQKK
jgi:hypothetical protein